MRFKVSLGVFSDAYQISFGVFELSEKLESPAGVLDRAAPFACGSTCSRSYLRAHSISNLLTQIPFSNKLKVRSDSKASKRLLRTRITSKWEKWLFSS